MGVRPIKTHGGIALVRDSGDAAFAGMSYSPAAKGLERHAMLPTCLAR